MDLLHQSCCVRCDKRAGAYKPDNPIRISCSNKADTHAMTHSI